MPPVLKKGKARASTRDAELENARLGVIFFLGSLDVSLAPESSISDLKNQAARFIKSKTGKLDKVLDKVGKGVDTIDGAVNDICDAVKEWLCARFKVNPADAELAIQHLRHNLPPLIYGIQEEIGKEAKDFGGLGGIARGLYTAITKTIEYFDLKHKGKDVAMESGHPELIARSIVSGVGKSALIGLAEAAVAGAKAALAAFTAGVGLIINQVAGIIEMLLRFAVRFCDAIMLSRIFRKAKEYWAQRGQPNALQTDVAEFTDWFKWSLDKQPIVGALIMNCGIAGDSLRFLRICVAGERINQGQFDQGVVYLNALKSSASDYIRTYQEQVRITSKDKMVSSLLAHAGEIGLVQKEASSGWRAQLFSWSSGSSKKSQALRWGLDKLGFKQSTVFGT
jgi:hypothetical protein